MAKIYARARAVVVWLAPATEASGRAMRTIRSLATLPDDEKEWKESILKPKHFPNMRRHGRLPIIPRRAAPSRTEEFIDTHEIGSLDKQDIRKLLNRPWFKRIWVVQEVAATRHSPHCYRVRQWRPQRPGALLRHRQRYAHMATQARSGDAVLTYPNRTHYVLMKNTDRKPRHLENDGSRFSLSLGRPLSDLIDKYRHREAMDRRDKVYALLGMCSDDPGALLSDYNISWSHLDQQLTRSVLKLTHPVVIDARDNRDSVTIKGEGYVVGR
ncbi:uncharacterized protein QC761_0016800 [Podospora bellae-mahoneyi]|uniref:Heterokaryon incompatibility domain-containing protein n=1 Tax=Podospora bellae-mahoneyi TaxID=2093777 RepID=A0ABR0FZU8_9PEZI|nr:hypothetical protein QC761_0016800 [Podospora bellae-mahoneyi]